MYYEKLKKLNMDKNPRNVLKLMGFLSDEQPTLACWCGNSGLDNLYFNPNYYIPSRFYASIKDDMLYICKSGFNGKVLSFFANISIKNIKFVGQTFVMASTAYIFHVKGDFKTFEFRLTPLTPDETWYANEMAKYITAYNKKEEKNNDL